MQELTFEQVEVVSGGFQGLTIPKGIHEPMLHHYMADGGSSSGRGGGGGGGGTGGITTAGAITGGSNLAAGATVAKALGAGPGLAVAVVGQIANAAFNSTQEGREGMRVQNHPATRHLYNADGTKNSNQ